MWREKLDEKRGRNYYVNDTTGESVWVLPQGATLKPSSAKARSTAATQAAGVESTPTSSPSNANEWRRLHDSKRGRDYFVNERTKERLWDLPSGGTLVSGSPRGKKKETSMQHMTMDRPIGPKNRRRPLTTRPKWRKKFDEKRGIHYYVNDETRESLWFLPDGAELTTEKPLRTATSTTARRSPNVLSADQIQNAGVWRKKHDTGRGRDYFVNDSSGESLWHVPPGATVIEPSDVWKRKWDKVRNAEYFVNETSRRSSWHLPDGAYLVPGDISAATALSSEGTSTPTAGETSASGVDSTSRHVGKDGEYEDSKVANGKHDAAPPAVITKRSGYRASVFISNTATHQIKGYLSKKSHLGIWQRRWFSIVGFYLNYHKDEHSPEVLASIDLRQIDDISRKAKMLILQSRDGKNFKLESDTEAKAIEWERALFSKAFDTSNSTTSEEGAEERVPLSVKPKEVPIKQSSRGSIEPPVRDPPKPTPDYRSVAPAAAPQRGLDESVTGVASALGTPEATVMGETSVPSYLREKGRTKPMSVVDPALASEDGDGSALSTTPPPAPTNSIVPTPRDTSSYPPVPVSESPYVMKSNFHRKADDVRGQLTEAAISTVGYLNGVSSVHQSSPTISAIDAILNRPPTAAFLPSSENTSFGDTTKIASAPPVSPHPPSTAASRLPPSNTITSPSPGTGTATTENEERIRLENALRMDDDSDVVPSDEFTAALNLNVSKMETSNNLQYYRDQIDLITRQMMSFDALSNGSGPLTPSTSASSGIGSSLPPPAAAVSIFSKSASKTFNAAPLVPAFSSSDDRYPVVLEIRRILTEYCGVFRDDLDLSSPSSVPPVLPLDDIESVGRKIASMQEINLAISLETESLEWKWSKMNVDWESNRLPILLEKLLVGKRGGTFNVEEVLHALKMPTHIIDYRFEYWSPLVTALQQNPQVVVSIGNVLPVAAQKLFAHTLVHGIFSECSVDAKAILNVLEHSARGFASVKNKCPLRDVTDASLPPLLFLKLLLDNYVDRPSCRLFAHSTFKDMTYLLWQYPGKTKDNEDDLLPYIPLVNECFNRLNAVDIDSLPADVLQICHILNHQIGVDAEVSFIIDLFVIPALTSKLFYGHIHQESMESFRASVIAGVNKLVRTATDSKHSRNTSHVLQMALSKLGVKIESFLEKVNRNWSSSEASHLEAVGFPDQLPNAVPFTRAQINLLQHVTRTYHDSGRKLPSDILHGLRVVEKEHHLPHAFQANQSHVLIPTRKPTPDFVTAASMKEASVLLTAAHDAVCDPSGVITLSHEQLLSIRNQLVTESQHLYFYGTYSRKLQWWKQRVCFNQESLEQMCNTVYNKFSASQRGGDGHRTKNDFKMEAMGMHNPLAKMMLTVFSPTLL